ncbi:C-X-C chemokine receptor type 6-like [Mixophyes fleayi]|uniref:C-X-C chemokine receptor type 6-like n=1 Tax=Mixophyes fleayi TaxID=3061075 RepID=UPI003F4DB3A6
MDYEEFWDLFEKNENKNTSDPYHHLHSLFLPITYSITSIFGLIGNLLVIIVFLFYEKRKTLTDTFLVNLALADFLFLCTLPFLAYESAHSWIFGEVMCKVIKGMYRINLYTSMLTLTAITVHRFISITTVTKPNKYQVYKHKWINGLCAMIWMFSLLLAVPQFKYLTSKNVNGCFDVYDPPHIELVVQSFQLAIGLLVPLTAMIFCYTFIIKTLITARSTQKKKSMKIIFILVAVFIATQLPYNVILFIVILEKIRNVHVVRALIILEAFAFMHACLNPVLYFFIGTKFRNNFWKIVRGLGLSKQQEECTNTFKMTDRDSKNISVSTNIEAISVQHT